MRCSRTILSIFYVDDTVSNTIRQETGPVEDIISTIKKESWNGMDTS